MELIATFFVAAIALILLFLLFQQYITGGVFWIAAEANKGKNVSLYILGFVAIALLIIFLIVYTVELLL